MLGWTKTLVFGGLLFVGLRAGALAASNKENAPKEEGTQTQPVPVVMYEFLGNFMQLQPFMVSNEKFKDPKNEKEIKDRLSKFMEYSNRLSHSQRLSTATLQLSATKVKEHFKDLYEVFNSGRKDYARRMLYATLDGCSSCHTQVRQDPKLRWEFKSNEIKGNAFERAEFYFAVRHYEEAIRSYNDFIANYKARKGDSFQIEQALRKKLVVFVRAKQAPQEALASFENDYRKYRSRWPKYLQDEVQGWIDALKRIPPKDAPNLKTLTPEALEALASKTLPPLLGAQEKFRPGSMVSYLYVSGMIYYYLNNHPEAEITAGLLYWLGVCDQHLEHSYFFSLADTYFEECIVRFAKSPVAAKCYQALEDGITDSYTGSKGVDIPEDVEAHLKELKSLIQVKD